MRVWPVVFGVIAFLALAVCVRPWQQTGRFSLTQSGEARSFLCDTETGRVWSLTAGSSRARAVEFPLPGYQPDPPQESPPRVLEDDMNKLLDLLESGKLSEAEDKEARALADQMIDQADADKARDRRRFLDDLEHAWKRP